MLYGEAQVRKNRGKPLVNSLEETKVSLTAQEEPAVTRQRPSPLLRGLSLTHISKAQMTNKADALKKKNKTHPANNQVSLEAIPSPTKPSDNTTAPSGTL